MFDNLCVGFFPCGKTKKKEMFFSRSFLPLSLVGSLLFRGDRFVLRLVCFPLVSCLTNPWVLLVLFLSRPDFFIGQRTGDLLAEWDDDDRGFSFGPDSPALGTLFHRRPPNGVFSLSLSFSSFLFLFSLFLYFFLSSRPSFFFFYVFHPRHAAAASPMSMDFRCGSSG